MAYMDLNPIRARMADTPEQSEHTSNPELVGAQPEALWSFAGYPRKNMPKGLPFRYTDYLELVDWSGRILRNDKRGAIPEDTPEILTRLNIDPRHWVYLTQDFESPFKSLVGCSHRIKQACEQMGKRWGHGLKRCSELFPDT